MKLIETVQPVLVASVGVQVLAAMRKPARLRRAFAVRRSCRRCWRW